MARKIIQRFIFIGVVCFIFFTGCSTVRYQPTDESVLEHQRRINELENRVRDYESRLEQYDSLISGTQSRLEAIRGRADSITDRVDRLIFLFSEYEREVQRLLDESNSIRIQGESAEEDNLLARFDSWLDVVAQNSENNIRFRKAGDKQNYPAVA